MYHHPQPFTPAGEGAHLQRGDVVLFRFPLAEEDDEPGAPKRRPCLVLIHQRGLQQRLGQRGLRDCSEARVIDEVEDELRRVRL